MLSRNLTYYRLKRGMTKKALAEGANVTPSMITYYETNQRNPSIDTLQALAACLGIGVSDLLRPTPNLQIAHGKFRKSHKLNGRDQKLVQMMVEDYLGRVFDAYDALMAESHVSAPIPNAPIAPKLQLLDDLEADAQAMRARLRISLGGPVPNLVQQLESLGFLMVPIDFDQTEMRTNAFSGMNGYVNGHPYIAFNVNDSGERNRSTIAHELAHLLFDWSGIAGDREVEDQATAISGAFLFPRADAFQRLGTHIALHGLLKCEDIAKTYGISMMLLATRAHILGIVNDASYRRFCIEAAKLGWRTSSERRIDSEFPTLLSSLVRKGIGEGVFSAQRGRELLGKEPDADELFRASSATG